jgi:putative sigma-54 modulation protein
MSRKSKAEVFIEETFPVTIFGRNVIITDAIRNYAIEKISKIEKFNLRIVDVQMSIEVQKISHTCGIILKVDHILVKSEGISEDMYASIDKAVDKLQAQIRKYHSKIRDHQAKGTQAIDMNVNILAPFSEEDAVLDVNGEIDQETARSLENRYRLPEVVAQDKLPLKILNNDEAIMKLELSGDQFLVFRCEEDMKLKVVFRRKDGNFGVIEPEV